MPANPLPNMMLTPTQLCTYALCSCALCSCALCLPLFTLVVSALQIHLFMQNEPNFRKSQMNLNDLLTRDYDKRTLGERGKNEPKTNPNEPNLSLRSLWRSRIKPNFKPCVLSVSSFCFSLFFTPAIICKCRPGLYKSS